MITKQSDTSVTLHLFYLFKLIFWGRGPQYSAPLVLWGFFSQWGWEDIWESSSKPIQLNPWQQLTLESLPKTWKIPHPASGPNIQGSQTWKFSPLPTGNQAAHTPTFSSSFQASIEQAKDQVFLPLPAPSTLLLGRLASYSLLLQHLSTYYSYSCWAAAFYSSCFLIGTFSQMGEANRSFINPFQVAAKCVGGLYVIFVNEVPSGIEPWAPFP